MNADRNAQRPSVSEERVLRIARKVFPGEPVLSRWRDSDWLEGLQLDIFVPEQSLAVEIRSERDKHKARLCQENGVRLLRLDERAILHLTDKVIAELLQCTANGPEVEGFPEA